MKKAAIVMMLLILAGLLPGQDMTKYDAFVALDMEKQEGFSVPDSAGIRLREIYAAMDSKIEFPSAPDKESAASVCYAMSDILRNDFGITYGNTLLLSEGLMKKELDCNFYSIVFYTWLKSKKQNPVLIITPGHMFLRWVFPDGSYINYETTARELYTDDDYIREFCISPAAIKNNLYMKPLSVPQLYACAYLDMSSKHEGNPARQRVLLNKSLKLFPELVMAMGNLAYCAVLENKTDEAITLLNKAIKLDTLNYVTYQQAGNIYRKAGRFDEAIRYYTKGIERNPDDPQSYIYRSNCYLDMKKVDEAMADFEKGADLLTKTNDIFKFLFDYLSYAALEDRIMDVYLKEAE